MRSFIILAFALFIAIAPACAEEEQLLANGYFITAAREGLVATLNTADLQKAQAYYTEDGWQKELDALGAARIIDRETGEVITPMAFSMSDIQTAGVTSNEGRERTVSIRIKDKSASPYKGYNVTMKLVQVYNAAKIEQVIITP